MNPITTLSAASAPAGWLSVPSIATAEQTASFKDFLLESIQQVNAMQQQADEAVERLFSGGEVTPAEVLTAVQKADIAFRLMLQVRNKLVQAYEETVAMRV